jgi:NAD(P)-dependent dehydrogenase (short-subunit alcohol dehydrogenase family)
MNRSEMLHGKHAVIFGAGGSIGSAIARQFATEGAEVCLSGRNAARVDEVAKAISNDGGRARAAAIDALDEVAVDSYLNEIAKRTGRIDIAFNAMGSDPRAYGNGKNTVDLSVEEFMLPLTSMVKSWFITARAAARHMVKQHSGVILFLTGSPARGHVEGATSIGTAFGAIETFMENLAFQVGRAGVRVVCLRTTANVDSAAIEQTVAILSDRSKVPKDEIVAQIASLNFLKVPARVADTAKTAAFLNLRPGAHDYRDRRELIRGTALD